MKPFDLNAALAGDLCVQRNGDVVKVAAYDKNARSSHRIIGWDSCGFVRAWNYDGRFSEFESELDIIGMAPKKEVREFWVNVYKDGVGPSIYKTENEANYDADKRIRIDCIKLTYEVEV